MDFVLAGVGIGDFKFQLIAGGGEFGIGGEGYPELVRRRTSAKRDCIDLECLNLVVFVRDLKRAAVFIDDFHGEVF